MKAPRSRRRPWPHFRDALLGVYAACLMCACTGGVGMPLKIAEDGGPELSGHAGSRASHGDGGPDYDYDMDETVKLTADCETLDAKWPASSAADEVALVELMNMYRQMPSTLCGPVLPAPPLQSNPSLQCVARQKAKNEATPRNQAAPAGYTPASPMFSQVANTPRRESQPLTEWRERQRVAGLDERPSVSSIGEVVISGASSVQAIAMALRDDPEQNSQWLCLFMFGGFGVPGATKIGGARSGNVWVMDFGGPPSPYSPHPGTGGR